MASRLMFSSLSIDNFRSETESTISTIQEELKSLAKSECSEPQERQKKIQQLEQHIQNLENYSFLSTRNMKDAEIEGKSLFSHYLQQTLYCALEANASQDVLIALSKNEHLFVKVDGYDTVLRDSKGSNIFNAVVQKGYADCYKLLLEKLEKVLNEQEFSAFFFDQSIKNWALIGSLNALLDQQKTQKAPQEMKMPSKIPQNIYSVFSSQQSYVVETKQETKQAEHAISTAKTKVVASVPKSAQASSSGYQLFPSKAFVFDGSEDEPLHQDSSLEPRSQQTIEFPTLMSSA